MQIRGGSFDARKNIYSGVAIISGYIRRYEGDTLKALTAYNAGRGGMRKYYRKHNKPNRYARNIYKKYSGM